MLIQLFSSFKDSCIVSNKFYKQNGRTWKVSSKFIKILPIIYVAHVQISFSTTNELQWVFTSSENHFLENKNNIGNENNEQCKYIINTDFSYTKMIPLFQNWHSKVYNFRFCIQVTEQFQQCIQKYTTIYI